MATVIGVRFKKASKVYYFDPTDVWPNPGDYVIVETVRGVELGEVVTGAREVSDEQIVAPLKKVIRVAAEEDVQRMEQNEAREKEAFSVCQDRVEQHKLEMKLVDVEYTFDNSKIIFYFTANGRVDFRELVKDLASVFKMRIELRQIGVRDEAKMLGGLGSCGRPICCRAFLSDFQPVSIKMAKEQNLSLNPTKISGQCGRLMCCLKYEQENYEAIIKKLPKVGREIQTPDGIGIILEINVIREKVRVRIRTEDGSIDVREYDVSEVQRPAGNAQPAANEPPKDARAEKGEQRERRGPREQRDAREQKEPREPREDRGRRNDHRGPRGKDAPREKDAAAPAADAENGETKPDTRKRRYPHPKGPKQLNTDQYFDKLNRERSETTAETPSNPAPQAQNHPEIE